MNSLSRPKRTSNRLNMPRLKAENIPIYRFLNKGTGLLREKGFTLTEEPRPSRGYTKERVYFSEISKCARLLWFELNEPDKLIERKPNIEIDADNERMAQYGIISEHYIIHIMKLGGAKISDQQKRLSVHADRFSGKIDGIVWVFDQPHLLEIKALKHDKIEKLVKYGCFLGARSYYDQIQLYLHFLEFSAGYLVAMDRDNQQFYVEYITQNINYAKFLIQKAKLILDSTQPTVFKETMMCRDCYYCPAQELCPKLDGKEKFVESYVKFQKAQL
jgi:CRISPR/Cas system-associated exonuclease Cas4 (RecB family)